MASMSGSCRRTTLNVSLVSGHSLAGTWPDPMSAAGRRLGRYLLIERLGRGCQGDVWKALQVEPVGVEVALKMLPPELARDPKRLAQFRREAERGSRLANASLLPIHEYGEADGVVFIAMPLVNGCSLSDILAWRLEHLAGAPTLSLHRLATLPEADYHHGVARVAFRVARALAVAHAAQVVHRDIKPANILLERGRADGVFLCDFGLGRDLDIATPAQLRDGAGTPLYMAPERLLKQRADEVRCDIYALGATLFEALTLAPPFQVPDDLPRSAWAAFLAAAKPPRPRAIRETVPEPLEAIVLKGMNRNPLHRYPTATALADDLHRFLAENRPSQSIGHRPVSRGFACAALDLKLRV